jgi:hypothetical protein
MCHQQAQLHIHTLASCRIKEPARGLMEGSHATATPPCDALVGELQACLGGQRDK